MSFSPTPEQSSVPPAGTPESSSAPLVVPAHPSSAPLVVPAHPSSAPLAVPAHPSSAPLVVPAHPSSAPLGTMVLPGAPSSEDRFAQTPYRELRAVGTGGMGDVYLVEHRSLGRRFVAKVLHAHLTTEPQFLDRLRIEAQTLGQLSHPNVVAVAGFGQTADARPFLVMEYLEGRSLAEELLERGALPIDEALALAEALLSALSAVHALGIVHRDVKPHNLFLANLADGSRRLKVLDFGLARVVPGVNAAAPAPLNQTTQTGVIMGTPGWVSPEGARGEAVDHRADLYAAGLVLYTMLAGVEPFAHLGPEANLLAAHAFKHPRPLSELRGAEFPRELEELLELALRKERGARFQSAEQFRQAVVQLRAWVARVVEPPQARPSVASVADVSMRPSLASVADVVARPSLASVADVVARPSLAPAPDATARVPVGLLISLFFASATLAALVVGGLLFWWGGAR